jgi:hypothetical protein
MLAYNERYPNPKVTEPRLIICYGKVSNDQDYVQRNVPTRLVNRVNRTRREIVFKGYNPYRQTISNYERNS